jgi:hypothetical protein
LQCSRAPQRRSAGAAAFVPLTHTHNAPPINPDVRRN